MKQHLRRWVKSTLAVTVFILVVTEIIFFMALISVK